jgi:uncharacterized protein (DUF488 family)
MTRRAGTRQHPDDSNVVSTVSSVQLYSIGHSTLAIDSFLDLLQRHAIRRLVDIRRFPGSRKFPQFNRESLERSLTEAGLEYRWMEALGGRRPRQKQGPSPNTGLRNDSFRNYADYMATSEFRSAMDELADVAASAPTAIMCSEAVYWRCHRRLVSDDLLAHGGVVQHIMSDGKLREHQLTPGAVVRGQSVTYPGNELFPADD